MKAVILAAGQGVRLKPLTNTRPKAMLQVAGKPILHHLLLELKKAGIKDAIIVVRYMKEKIIEYFKKNDLGMRLTFVEQNEKNGTAAAILTAEKNVNESFIVVAGDIVTEANLIKEIINAHKENRTNITIALKRVDNPNNYGVAEVVNGKVKAFQEKPKEPKSDLVNISVYCMESNVFNDIKKIKPSARNEYEITEILVGAKAVVPKGEWNEITYAWDLFKVNEYLLSKAEAQDEAIENSTVKGKVIMEKGAKVFDSYIEGISYVSENCIIGPGAYLRGFNSFGKNCEIAGSTTVKNSILFDNVKAKHLSYIGDSVIGENVNIAAGTQIANFRFDSNVINVLTEKGWVNSGRKKLGAIIGDNTKFGVLSSTMPGKLIGENCWIGSGAIINKNIDPNTHVLVKQVLTEYKERKEE